MSLALFGDRSMERVCKFCRGTPALWQVGYFPENAQLCAPCADRMVSCSHDSCFHVPVDRDDGEIWWQEHCDECGFITWDGTRPVGIRI